MILAVGNELRGDDVVGILAGRLLEQLGRKVIFAYEAPENFFSKLRERTVVLDACANCEEPFQIGKDVSPSITHKVNYSQIAKKLGLELLVVGIRGYNFGFGAPISEKAKANAHLAANYVNSLDFL